MSVSWVWTSLGFRVQVCCVCVLSFDGSARPRPALLNVVGTVGIKRKLIGSLPLAARYDCLLPWRLARRALRARRRNKTLLQTIKNKRGRRTDGPQDDTRRNPRDVCILPLNIKHTCTKYSSHTRPNWSPPLCGNPSTTSSPSTVVTQDRTCPTTLPLRSYVGTT